MGSVPTNTNVHPSALPAPADPTSVPQTLKALSLQPHFEGGFFAETDRAQTTIPSPFSPTPASPQTLVLVGGRTRPGFDPSLRTLSSTIFYYLTPTSPVGHFHRNRCRITHSLHSGRGRYMLLHPDGSVESFVVGRNTAAGERVQWVVGGGDYKASFVLPDQDRHGERGGEAAEGLLITEVAVPGFDFCDHDFLTKDALVELVGEEKSKELEWLLLKIENVK
ncbi:Uncharacterized protein Cob_v000274 [Colletotrichum orbiculare MAFF 240422]|uniref:DUF985 domain-containing protein n=1 Tax=Colletotrichum orbiculare (strain 104-T / ATCC 96160 / CBS 514.97 / LARS 414 / MAFF 240422) TaxID=1213857 RepID=N4V3C1_COLOR|nr:Uncharacterized protein Cob_v000274 [Colletotrichum orbiculare MAFF 240422]